MARNREMDADLSPFIDDESGAIYSIAITDNSFDELPVKRLDRIGMGSTGTVDLMQSTKNPKELYAAKKILLNSTSDKYNESKRRTFLKETAILQSLDHQNIVKLHFSGLGPGRGVLLINFCNKGPLYTDDLSNEQVFRYFIHILDAVRHMHSRRIVHRDIKLDNLLVNDDDVFLTDFSHSQQLSEDDNSVSGRVGTPNYFAPEVYHACRNTVYDGLKADAYCVGVVLYCLLVRDDPPHGLGVFNLWPLLQSSKNFDSMDSTLIDCARQLLEVNPYQRSDVTSLYHTLCQSGCVPGYTDDDMEYV